MNYTRVMTKGTEMILALHGVTYFLIKHADPDVAQVKQGTLCNVQCQYMLHSSKHEGTPSQYLAGAH